MNDIQKARKVIWDRMKSDPDFRESYLANIACMLMDAQAAYGTKIDMMDYRSRMAVADRILNHMYREE